MDNERSRTFHWVDTNGKLYAHGTAACMKFPLSAD